MSILNFFQSALNGERPFAQVNLLGGVCLGLIFPLVGTIVQALLVGHSLNPMNLLEVQSSTPLLWIIDSAPLFLGLAGLLVDRRQSRIVELNEILDEKVKERTVELEAAIRSMDREIRERRQMEAEVRHACRVQMHMPIPEFKEIPQEPEISIDATTSTEAASLLQGLRILLVDDNRINQKVASLMLRKLGCSVFVAKNGLEAVELTESDSFDLALMDCHMPVMDGFDATRRIRANENGGPRMPILALTASTLKSDQQLCFDAGMDDHIPKPVKSDILAERIGYWIGEKDALKF